MIRLSLAIILTLAALGAFGLDVAARLGPPTQVRGCEVLSAGAHSLGVSWMPRISLNYVVSQPCRHCNKWRHEWHRGQVSSYCPGRDEMACIVHQMIWTFEVGSVFCLKHNLGGRHASYVLSVAHWTFASLVLTYPLVYLISAIRRRIPPGHCKKCTYNLTGNTSGVCPECGTPATPQVYKESSVNQDAYTGNE